MEEVLLVPFRGLSRVFFILLLLGMCVALNGVLLRDRAEVGVMARPMIMDSIDVAMQSIQNAVSRKKQKKTKDSIAAVKLRSVRDVKRRVRGIVFLERKKNLMKETRIFSFIRKLERKIFKRGEWISLIE